MGNLLIQQASIRQVDLHRPLFSDTDTNNMPLWQRRCGDSASKEQGRRWRRFYCVTLNWEAHEHHPADACDRHGIVGQSFPNLRSALSDCAYDVNGTARSINVNPDRWATSFGTRRCYAPTPLSARAKPLVLVRRIVGNSAMSSTAAMRKNIACFGRRTSDQRARTVCTSLYQRGLCVGIGRRTRGGALP